MLRLPTLVHHYFEHVEWDNNNSLIDFLAIHYCKDINHPDDQHNDHENLPFKTGNDSLMQVVSLPQPQLTISQQSCFGFNFKIPVRNHPVHSNSNTGSIWQPPRFS